MSRFMTILGFALWLLVAGLQAAEPPIGDLNGDLRVDYTDFAMMADHWLEDNRPPVQVRWYGHTTWKIWREDVIIYIDPVGLRGAVPDATLVLVSHTHGDHYSAADINRISGPNTVFLGATDVVSRQGWGKALLPGQTHEMEGIRIEGVSAYNTNKPNHPRSNNWLGFVIEFGGLRFYYGGDTDAIPEMQALQDIDVAIIPIGGTYTMNAAEAAAVTQDFKPALTLPSHWGRNVGNLSDARFFAERAFGDVIILQEGERLNLKDRDPATPLLAHWPLNETEGDLAFDFAGAHTGQLQGNAWWQVGLKGGAVALNGDGDAIMAEFVLNPVDGPFTVSAWILGGGPGQTIVAQSGSEGKDWLAIGAEGRVAVDLGSSGRGGHPLLGDRSVTDGLWHHVALVWDGDLRRLYLDGVLNAMDASSVAMENIDTDIVLGSSWQGLLDEVRIYGSALAVTEMAEIAD